MRLKSGDLKKIWARSGNICSFPGCGVELAPEKKMNQVIGEEAHIKGEKPLAARYDPNQSEEERKRYDNRILLCPTHHTEIDADPETWTVEALRRMKTNHEQQVSQNWQFPQLMDEFRKIVQRFPIPEDAFEFSATDVIEDSEVIK